TGAVGPYGASLGVGEFADGATPGGEITALGPFAGLNNSAAPGVPLAPGLPPINFSAAPFGSSGFTNVGLVLGVPGTLNGASLNDRWNQSSNTWALFTHNIISFTDQLKLT